MDLERIRFHDRPEVPPSYSGRLPVCQPQHEQLQEGGFKEQVLVRFRKISEAGDFFCPSSDDLHGAGQEIIELLDVLSVVSAHLVVGVSLELEIHFKKHLMRFSRVYNP